MISESAGVILAGGNSSRFGSRKALAPWGTGKLIDSVVEVLSKMFPLTLVLVKKSEDFSFLNRKNVQVIEDLVLEAHPLSGIYSALCYSKRDRIFVCGCDMPFLQPPLVQSLWDVSLGYDATVPVWQGKSQALCGFYTQKCKGFVEGMMKKKKLAVQGLFSLVSTRFFLEEEIQMVDPQGLSFWDLDTPKDYKRAKEYAGRLF